MNSIKYQIFDNNQWIDVGHHGQPHISTWRRIEDFDNNYVQYFYYLGWKKHRLDGPAIEVYEESKLFYVDWFVNGKCLEHLSNYIDNS